MFWTSLFWTLLLGTWPGIPTEVYSGLLSYNDYSFETSNIRVKSIENIENLDSYSFTTYKTARRDWEWYVSWNIDRKRITVKGIIKVDTVSELQEAMESMKQKLFVPNSLLWYRKWDGAMVYTNASCTGLVFNRQYFHLTYVPFECVFETLEPFFYSIEQQEASFTGKSATFTDTIDNPVGNYKALPIISVNFISWLSGVTTVSINLNGNVVSATWTFTDADILTFNCNTKDVALNSVGWQDYTGVFWDLPIWNNDIEVTVNGTRTADIYVLWYGTYV